LIFLWYLLLLKEYRLSFLLDVEDVFGLLARDQEIQFALIVVKTCLHHFMLNKSLQCLLRIIKKGKESKKNTPKSLMESI
jgi:hypothetical protein